MDLKEAVVARHSVRRYIDKQIDEKAVNALRDCIEECNNESGLHIQLVLNEPKAFDSLMARYGSFSGVENYVALIGGKSEDLDEKIGYYGEKIALFAQTLGLNTCWVAMTYKKIKTAFVLNKGEKLCMVLALGYGKTSGVAHKSKPIESVCAIDDDTPEWFIDGVKCALLAPTAINQQKFFFTLKDNAVSAKAGMGFYTKVDLGIAKYHFEIGAGKENFVWG